MPPFFDRVQLHDALQNQAIPVLEALVANDNLHNRSFRRFERDDPPPYASSTESEEFNDDFLAPPPPRGELPDELKAIMEQPINDDEMKHIVFDMGSILDPVDFYHTEAKREESRVEEYRSNKIFRGVEGSRRCGVLVRHNVKRRWEKLGIWNPEWGFAGRNVQPNDNAYRWKWRWEQQTADDSESAGYGRDTQMEQLVARALRLRQNLRRGENAPVLPQSCLEQDATASQAESFIISRPWFIFRIELAEERARYDRLSVDEQRRYPYSARKQVIKWWKERGDWREEFDRKNWVTSWKWRHESPSPEPEDLTPINNNRKDSPLDTTDMDFTPSEIDDLETIEFPSSEQPKGFWTIRRKDSGLRAPFPGQLLEPFQPPPPPPGSLLYAPPGSLPPRRSIFEKTPSEEEHDETLLEEYEDLPQELEQNPPEPQQYTTSPPTQKPRRQLQRQLQDRMDSAQDLDHPPPLPRRARIAGMKRPAEPLPSQPASKKKPRGRAAPKAEAPAAQPTTQETQRRKPRSVPARPPPKIETETRPKRGRGRPRKENGPGTRSAVTKKKAARTPIPANPIVNGSHEAGEAPAIRIFGSPSPVESNHRQASGALNSSQQEPSADIDSAGLENGNAERSPSAPNSPRLRTGRRVLRPTTGHPSRPSKRNPSHKDGQPASASLGPVHSSKVSKAAVKKKPGPQQRLNISQKVSSDGLPLSSGVDAAEPQPSPSPDRAAPRRSKRIQPPVPSVSKDPTRTASTNPSKRALRSKPERKVASNLATRSSAKPQGVSKRQAAKTTRGNARKK